MTQDLFEKLQNAQSPQEIVDTCDEILEKVPFMLDIKFLKANWLIELKKFDEALEIFNEGLEYGASDVSCDAHNGIAKCYAAQGNLKKALVELKKAHEFEENDIQTLINMGYTYASLNDNINSIDSFEKVLKIDPNNKIAKDEIKNLNDNPFTKLSKKLHEADELQENGKFNDALEIYQKLLDKYPNCIPALNNLGQLYDEMGELDKALECYDRVLELNPQSLPALINKAMLCINLEDWENASDSFSKYLDINPDNEYVLANNALVLIKLGEYENAVENCEKSLKINPNNPETYTNMAYAYEELKDWKNALECYDKSIEIDPNRFITWNNKGSALKTMGEYEKAEECYEKAIEIDPENDYVWKRAAENYELMGNLEKAKEYYEKALELDQNI